MLWKSYRDLEKRLLVSEPPGLLGDRDLFLGDLLRLLCNGLRRLGGGLRRLGDGLRRLGDADGSGFH